MFLSNLRLVRSELVLHVAYKLLEVALVVQDELADHGLVDLDRRELVLCVLNDHSGQFGEVLGDFRRTICHDQNVLRSQFIQKLSVVIDAREKRLRSPLRDVSLLGSLLYAYLLALISLSHTFGRFSRIFLLCLVRLRTSLAGLGD